MLPIGLCLHKKPDQLIRAAMDVCLITHTEPRALAASAAVAYLIARLLRSTDRCSPADQVLDTADRIASLDNDMASMLRWVTQVVHLPPEEALFEIGTSLDAMEAIPAATYCFLKHPKDYGSAVLTAVNAGDAADSIGALTGSFVGALMGIDAIPMNWRHELEDNEVVSGVGHNLASLAA
jgi:ADP-ribosyl-[dinitrogen reductase] hydrolase